MRWLVLALAILVLSFWQYQSQQAENTEAVAEVARHQEQRLADSLPEHSAQPHVSIPQIANSQDWLQAELKHLFDHYILEHEEDLEAMWSAFNEYCQPLVACPEIKDLFQRYLDYKVALADIDDDRYDQSLATVNHRLADVESTKQAFFSQVEIDVLFADERDWQQEALSRLAIRQDDSLTQVQKADLLQQHYESLDQTSYRAIKPSLQLQQVTEMAQNTKLNEDNYNELAAKFGREAAERLLLVAKKQQAWRDKTASFQQRVAQLKQEYEGDALSTAIAELKTQMFEPNEIKRLNAMLGGVKTL